MASNASRSTRKNAKQFCSLPITPDRQFEGRIDPNRLSLLRSLDRVWANGTVLHYAFFDDKPRWRATDAEKEVVRQAFETWKKVGIGLEFEHVTRLEEAEIRIGFQAGDGAWSYLGRDILDQPSQERTMNLGWDVTLDGPNGLDTVVHEIGHTLGFPHEHQNPNAGIAWDEEAVYAALAAPPNGWTRAQTFHNIIRKLDPQSFEGSTWDPDSIMHYPFEAGLIVEPADYRNGLDPAPGLSDIDQVEVRNFYPPILPTDYERLEPLSLQRLEIGPGGQLNYVVRPEVSGTYNFRTFGLSDTVMVLFEGVDHPRFLAGDDDSGTSLNASIRTRLFADRTYLLRLRLYWEQDEGRTALLMW